MADFDVLISGYGPSGALAANLLGARGLRVLVVERSPQVFQIPRAVHFDGECMRVFQHAGLADEVSGLCALPEGLAFVNAAGRTLLTVRTEEVEVRHAWPPANFFSQPQLESHLRRGAARFASVEVRLGWALEGFEQDADAVRVRLRPEPDGAGEEVTARYLLGCDGASSPVREQLGLALEDMHCEQPWLVCDVVLDESAELRRMAFQICDHRRPTTMIACGGGHIRWEFMLRPGDDPAELEKEENVRALMAPHLHRLGEQLRPDQGRLLRSKVYTFHGLVAHEFRVGRVFLLGDAAHQTPPFLGQGLCAGIRDAFNLCWKLDGVLGGRFQPSLLDTYTSERRPHARAVVEKAVRVGRVIQTTSAVGAFLRDAYFALARVAPILRRPFVWEPSWPLGGGLFEDATPPSAHSAHGNPIDQPVVRTAEGKECRLDELLGDGFALLGWGVDPARLLDEKTAKILDELGTRLVRVVPKGSTQREPDAVVDSQGALAAWFDRVGGGRAVLLRPDRCVYGCYGRDESTDLSADLARASARLAARLAGAGGRT